MGFFSFLEEEEGGTLFGDFLQIDIRSRRMYLQSARMVCEAIFFIALLGYRTFLDANYKRSLNNNSTRNASMWSSSLDHANKALSNAMQAADKHTAGEKDEADELAQSALSELKER
jgi:hypothetical protein